MITLVLIYCLSVGSCIEQRRPLDVSLMGCVLAAQQIAPEWIEAHPSYRLAAFRCEQAKGKRV